MAFRFIAGNDHPDHDTIATFRKRFLKEIEALFVRVLMLAKEMGVLQMGTVALDGTKRALGASGTHLSRFRFFRWRGCWRYFDPAA